MQQRRNVSLNRNIRNNFAKIIGLEEKKRVFCRGKLFYTRSDELCVARHCQIPRQMINDRSNLQEFKAIENSEEEIKQ